MRRNEHLPPQEALAATLDLVTFTLRVPRAVMEEKESSCEAVEWTVTEKKEKMEVKKERKRRKDDQEEMEVRLV